MNFRTVKTVIAREYLTKVKKEQSRPSLHGNT